MDRQPQAIVRTAEEAVNRLIELSQKNGPLYNQKPKVVAHVSRTSKWLLNALTALKQELPSLQASQKKGKR
jgi:hypothetical protein